MTEQLRDLKTFKEQIKQKMAETSFENVDGFARWCDININNELSYLYKPKNKLTFHGIVDACPNDKTELVKQVVAHKWELFGLWKYTILTCPTCGYEYAKMKNIRSRP